MNLITNAMGAQITAAITADSVGLEAMNPKLALVENRHFCTSFDLAANAKPSLGL